MFTAARKKLKNSGNVTAGCMGVGLRKCVFCVMY